MNSEDLAQDLTGAENLIERHQDTKSEMDSRADNFSDAVNRGRQLEDAPEDIPEKIEDLERERQEVSDLWEEKLVLYQQCMDLQLFYRSVCYSLL